MAAELWQKNHRRADSRQIRIGEGCDSVDLTGGGVERVGNANWAKPLRFCQNPDAIGVLDEGSGPTEIKM
ncbi:MAG TPA: hypothetical protein VF503_22435 [Sphingobium sp.]|uniref:hypothetical protein n=1 Tax=Sphingobium sp. TaxID=1912891 RepID=UPI002ED13759